MKIGSNTSRATAQGTPRASAEKFQRSRTQWRAKSGVTAAVREGATVGEMEVFPAAAETKTTATGMGDTI